ncbi:unnamed protein product, partial [Callosobruchus maculatus]
MDQQDKGFDVALYLNRITFDQLQKSPSQNKVAENTEWEQEVSDSLERFSITATIHNYSMAPTDLTDLELFLHDAELRELQRKVPIKKKIMQLFKTRRRRGSMTKDEFDNETDRLYKCCLRSCQDLHELHIRRLIGYIEESSINKPPRHSRYMMVVMYDVVKLIQWRRVPPETIDNFMKKLLDMLRCNSEHHITKYNCLALRKGIRTCICNMIEVLWKKRLVKLVSFHKTTNFGKMFATIHC